MKQKALLKITYEAIGKLLKLSDLCVIEDIFKLSTPASLCNESVYIKISGKNILFESHEGTELPIILLEDVQGRQQSNGQILEDYLGSHKEDIEDNINDFGELKPLLIGETWLRR